MDDHGQLPMVVGVRILVTDNGQFILGFSKYLAMKPMRTHVTVVLLSRILHK
ncbi:hypothetical protein [Alicyclobacillus ferrooxydans]|uniref:hypothetical protein n=1 Tax=Alicyclobacillus ferrooxydans TaxID=471514 RepID=UPI000A729DA9|nr:hypothetical protein [Alicyclobacillus ferrooxydans]